MRLSRGGFTTAHSSLSVLSNCPTEAGGGPVPPAPAEGHSHSHPPRVAPLAATPSLLLPSPSLSPHEGCCRHPHVRSQPLLVLILAPGVLPRACAWVGATRSAPALPQLCPVPWLQGPDALQSHPLPSPPHPSSSASSLVWAEPCRAGRAGSQSGKCLSCQQHPQPPRTNAPNHADSSEWGSTSGLLLVSYKRAFRRKPGWQADC